MKDTIINSASEMVFRFVRTQEGEHPSYVSVGLPDERTGVLYGVAVIDNEMRLLAQQVGQELAVIARAQVDILLNIRYWMRFEVRYNPVETVLYVRARYWQDQSNEDEWNTGEPDKWTVEKDIYPVYFVPGRKSSDGDSLL